MGLHAAGLDGLGWGLVLTGTCYCLMKDTSEFAGTE